MAFRFDACGERRIYFEMSFVVELVAPHCIPPSSAHPSSEDVPSPVYDSRSSRPEMRLEVRALAASPRLSPPSNARSFAGAVAPTYRPAPTTSTSARIPLTRDYLCPSSARLVCAVAYVLGLRLQ